MNRNMQSHACSIAKKQLMDNYKKGEGYDGNQTRQFGNTRV